MAVATHDDLGHLERELTCGICTEILYQPLTLLDCLHTFCGSCLQQWFEFQARSTTSRSIHPYTCPSCRAEVRDTRPNATVTTLLELVLMARPEKGKSPADKIEIAKVYKPGDAVCKPVHASSSLSSDDDTSEDESSSDDSSSDQQGRRRSERQVITNPSQHSPEQNRNYQIGLEHQSSLRSMISASDIEGSADMQEEIMRQIVQDGLLEGIDLSNLTPEQEDEVSDRIAEAIRRRRLRQRRRRTSGEHHRQHLVLDRQHQGQDSTQGRGSTQSPAPSPASRVPSAASPDLVPRPLSIRHRDRQSGINQNSYHSRPEDVHQHEGISTATTIACSRCGKEDIQGDLHYNCSECNFGNFNLCQDCYRAGKGCLHWYGFGYAAMVRFQNSKAATSAAPPHVLSARRKRPNELHKLGSSEQKDWQEGLFCEYCHAHCNAAYWHCEVCNDGAWGYCRECVRKGRSCTHPLEAVAKTSYVEQSAMLFMNPHYGWSPYGRPPPAGITTRTKRLPHVRNPDDFIAMSVSYRCVNCDQQQPPTSGLYHCLTCPFQTCTPCHDAILAGGENSIGAAQCGRCPEGCSSSFIVAFVRREQDQALLRTVIKPPMNPSVDDWTLCIPKGSWHWEGADEVFVLNAQAGTLDRAPSTRSPLQKPLRAKALWSRWPRTEDELSFPRGAVITEVQDINGDWLFGLYLEERGLVPANYVRIIPQE